MKKSFLKGASIFLASVLTVGMCSAYSVNAKAKFSLPKKTTLSYDKKNNGENGFYTNVIYIKGTNRSNSESILRNGMKVKSSNRKVISTKTFGKDSGGGGHLQRGILSGTEKKRCIFSGIKTDGRKNKKRRAGNVNSSVRSV